eukprot:9035760-Pyramimonas_sp.AAC.1
MRTKWSGPCSPHGAALLGAEKNRAGGTGGEGQRGRPAGADGQWCGASWPAGGQRPGPEGGCPRGGASWQGGASWRARSGVHVGPEGGAKGDGGEVRRQLAGAVLGHSGT